MEDYIMKNQAVKRYNEIYWKETSGEQAETGHKKSLFTSTLGRNVLEGLSKFRYGFYTSKSANTVAMARHG